MDAASRLRVTQAQAAPLCADTVVTIARPLTPYLFSSRPQSSTPASPGAQRR